MSAVVHTRNRPPHLNSEPDRCSASGAKPLPKPDLTDVISGKFQWTPYKHACLKHCRSPLDFLMTDWREGTNGALIMGLRHGAFCLGCCWALMCLLFVAGVMNLLWVAVITTFVLIEKVVPAGHWVGRMAGVGLIAWGITMATTSL